MVLGAEMTEEQLRKQREYRARTGNAVTARYEKTKKGKLMRSYRNMQSRVKGVQWRKSHLYEGKELLPRSEFYEWAMADESFNRLYDEWVNSGFDRKLSPSVDRINPKLGYEITNMRWITHSENSRLGAISRFRSKEQ